MKLQRTQRRRARQLCLAAAALLCAAPAACRAQDKPSGAAKTSQNPAITGPEESTDRRIHFFQAQVQRDPYFSVSYNRLASAYALKARETGDISYFELAETALKKSLELESTHPDAAAAFTQMAAVHLAEHRFTEAAADADHAIALAGGDLSAWPYAGDAQLELGNYAAAEKIYARLADPGDGKPHQNLAFLEASHGSGLHWILGKDKLACDDMRRAAELAEDLHLPAENLAWTRFMLGEQLFQAGDLTAAEQQEQASLQAFPRYHRALAELARIKAAQGRLEESVALYKQALAIVPLPVYAAALGDVYRAQGKPAEAEKQYALVDYIAKLSELSKQVFNRELALFYADHDRQLPQSLSLARKELEVRHDIYTSDALAWAMYKNGDAAGAREPMEQALRFGTRDALLEFHAGMIYARLGEKTKAAAHLERALAINPNFHILYATIARNQLQSLHQEQVSAPGARPGHAT